MKFVLIDAVTGKHPRNEASPSGAIKQNGGPDERRYVVRMWISVGDSRSRIDVNLADRSGFEYPLLIGRNFLTDTMIVDVSRHHTSKQKPPHGVSAQRSTDD